VKLKYLEEQELVRLPDENGLGAEPEYTLGLLAHAVEAVPALA
jgi:hypothetical protein